jgi:hypothetical protein
MKRETPNPVSKAGKPFSLAPHSFEDALRKILAEPPEPKPDRKMAKKTPNKTTSEKINSYDARATIRL